MSKKIIAISGSLKKNSYNTALLNEIKTFVPDLEIISIGDLPLFNEDLEANFPAAATALKQKIEAADAVIFATPEYNRSIPGVLKNAIDWASRPWGKNSFAGKQVLVIGASMGPIGTAVAQYDLKKVMLYLDAHVIGQPEFYLGTVQDKIKDGKIVDQHTMDHLKKAVQRLIDLA